jgi:hypothetical protein
MQALLYVILSFAFLAIPFIILGICFKLIMRL